MPKPPYVPDEKDLRKAWRMKTSNKTIAEISKALGISVGQYARARDRFNDFFKRKMKAERIKFHKQGLPEELLRKEKKKPGRKKKPNPFGAEDLKENDFDYDMIRAYSTLGYNHKTIARLLMLSPSSLLKYRKKYPLLDHVIEDGKRQISAQMVKNMQVQAADRMVDDTAVASFQGNISTQKIKRHAPGSPQLIKMWMTNEEGWSSEPKPEAKDNKGLILKMLGALTGDEEEENA